MTAMRGILDINRTIRDKVWNADRTGRNGILKEIFYFYFYLLLLF